MVCREKREERRMKAFRNALNDCQLLDIGYSRQWFTWTKGNFKEASIRERIDRGVVCG